MTNPCAFGTRGLRWISTTLRITQVIQVLPRNLYMQIIEISSTKHMNTFCQQAEVQQ